MRILALDTSTLVASVAILEEDRLLADCSISPPRRVAQSLAPTILELLNRAAWSPRDIQLIAVAQGPGSFTGLRVGVTTAKTMAYACSAELLGVDTLEAITRQAPGNKKTLWAVMDAQRQQLFAASFSRDQGGALLRRQDTHIVDNQAWLDNLAPDQAVTGPGLRNLLDRLPSQVSIVDKRLWAPQASTIGTLAWHAFGAGQRDDFWKLTPRYFRKSAAEEKLAKRQ